MYLFYVLLYFMHSIVCFYKSGWYCTRLRKWSLFFNEPERFLETEYRFIYFVQKWVPYSQNFYFLLWKFLAALTGSTSLPLLFFAQHSLFVMEALSGCLFKKFDHKHLDYAGWLHNNTLSTAFWFVVIYCEPVLRENPTVCNKRVSFKIGAILVDACKIK